MASSGSLRGKLALITGCSGGIGSATARVLGKQGCAIAVHYNSATTKAKALVSELKALGVKAEAFQADLSDYSNVHRLHEQVVEKMGHPNVLFNNSAIANNAIGITGDIEKISVEEFENTWRVNTGSSFLLTQLCIPNMVQNKFGRIIFCSSVAAKTGGVVGPHYASSKSALHGLLHWIALRYAKDGITCNAVAPALIIGTTMFDFPNDELKNKIPVGRFGLPEEIASVVELLATNAYMTNKIVTADGGWVSGGI
ncbi:NAD-binding protein [Crepidotus variabilis]|uniref:3-oxoacyl-[acyl-carrier-protein] reductase n=1 Tax=Crepidotus variabilis TaxID=179855 RepID=A0A9P6EKC6_9AGAR|nr:NAD-binding protein [Crepidotus variabilis]